MADSKFASGTRVIWTDPDSGNRARHATVMRHGRDRSGTYTEIRAEDDGERYRVHRASISREDCNV